jgi:hypothetical protein
MQSESFLSEAGVVTELMQKSAKMAQTSSTVILNKQKLISVYFNSLCERSAKIKTVSFKNNIHKKFPSTI